MTEQLRYIGPVEGASGARRSRFAALRRISLSFALVVLLPTVLGALYWGLIATPRYVSEAHFVVRKTDEARPSNLGLMLQNVGLSAGVADSFAIQEYMSSRDAAAALNTKFDFSAVFGRKGVDLFSRYPAPFVSPSDEAQYDVLRRYVSVSYNGGSGITTLRVQAFTAQDAQTISRALLSSGEDLVNRLNERAAADAVRDAELAVTEATARHAEVQQLLTNFRNKERFIDPQMAAAESSQLVSGLLVAAAQLRAELAQLQQSAPQSPQIPALQGRIEAYNSQIAAARSDLAGASGSLAPKVSTYEGLMLQKELADRALTEASAALVTARQDVRRQKLYLDRIVEPNLADMPTEPRRARAILIIFLSSLGVYLLGRLLWAGLREHRQE
ncbi:hypothetical protein [Brevundimonas naejangsanensis]|uniref:hypothetical protein n=1 Tax=Brevundimonas naejangsanensis TaxID=588932 RepID=UPI0004A468CD|nr:hypothetical protein [Brevundimonas naejangsanensis]